MKNATTPMNSRKPAKSRTTPDMAAFVRKLLNWPLTYLTSLFGIFCAFFIRLVDPLIAEHWGLREGLAFGLSMGFCVLVFGAFLTGCLIEALRREARR